MTEVFADRLLTLAETSDRARRYRVGIASVLRRCFASQTPWLTVRTVVD